MRTTIIVAVLTTFLGFPGCSVLIDNEGKECQSDADCDPGQTCDTTGEKAKCVDSCVSNCSTLNETQCNGTIIQTCTEAGDCLNWVDGDNCADSSQLCEYSGGSARCVDSCVNECDNAGDTSCSDTIIQTCTVGGDGCLDWVDGEDCDDGLYCNGAESCKGGSCVDGNPVECNDDNVCTDDSCNEETDSCDNLNISSSCEDGIFCNGEDSCDGSGNCSIHTGNPCGKQLCDEVDNVCGIPFVLTTTGEHHACGITAEGVAYCWGWDSNGQLGDGGTSSDSQVPVAVDTSTIVGDKSFIQLTAGIRQTCGLTAGGVAYCWGNDNFGKLGDGGTSIDSQSPVAVDTTPITGEKAFIQIETLGNHTCGLTAEGVAYCWGRDIYGQLGDGGTPVDSQSPVAVDTTPITGEKAFIHISVGYHHSCGLTAEGVAYCWGSDGGGQLGDGGTSIDSQSPVAVDISGITGVKAFIQLTTGYLQTCGLTAEGVAYCWGQDDFGQLGNGATPVGDCSGNPCSQSPVAVDISGIIGVNSFIQLSAGREHTCGLTAGGVLYCWGSDEFGQLGDGGSSVNSQSPVAVDTFQIPGDQEFVQVTAGPWHTCGITSGGVSYCWGSDDNGQLGDGGTSNDAQSPVAVDTFGVISEITFFQLASGYWHTCGLTSEGVAYCWGQDNNGQLGNGNMPIEECGVLPCSQIPVAVDTSQIIGDKAFVQLTGGSRHTCGLTADGVAYCWGSDEYGQLGEGAGSPDTCPSSSPCSQFPVLVDTSHVIGEKAFIQLTGGSNHTCGLTADGEAYCWGWDEYGQLGNGGTSSNSNIPVAVDISPIIGEKAFILLSAGGRHTCGLTAEGVVYCWGSDSDGQLGDGGANSDSQSPVPIDISPIIGDKTFTQITAGGRYTCGLTAEGAAYCWGNDEYGQLGDGGIPSESQIPVAVDTSPIIGDRAFTNITAEVDHTCGLTADGAAYCWGRDDEGQLGDGGISNDSQSAVAVDTSTIIGDDSFVQLAGGYHTCGLTAKGSVYCWGRDDEGQLGDGGTSTSAQSPVAVDMSPFCEPIKWIEMPSDSYMMGSFLGSSNEQPEHLVNISDFQLTRSEITVAQYKQCVDAGVCAEPGTGSNSNWGVKGREDHPVNYVTWDDAVDFCTWAGGRLPSEAEWEYAARSGGQNITFPWGDEAGTCEYAVMNDGGEGCGKNRTWSVCHKTAGNTAYGLCDMAGNVWEWVQDWWHDDYNGAPTDGSAWEDFVEEFRVLRGGSWRYDTSYLRSSFRGRSAPSDQLDSFGFRCAR